MRDFMASRAFRGTSGITHSNSNRFGIVTVDPDGLKSASNKAILAQ
jgi:hypothetical protein